MAQTGTSQVPLLYDNRPATQPERAWLRDTTSIIEYLEADTTLTALNVVPPVMPVCPVQAAWCFLAEDYADEYMWRPAMYFRWHPQFDSLSMSYRWTYEFMREYHDVPLFLRPHLCKFRQWLFSVFSEGIASPAQHTAVQQQYLQVRVILMNGTICQFAVWLHVGLVCRH